MEAYDNMDTNKIKVQKKEKGKIENLKGKKTGHWSKRRDGCQEVEWGKDRNEETEKKEK